MLFIKPDENCTKQKDIKTITFWDIHDVTLPENDILFNNQYFLPNGWVFCFNLKTRNRVFTLICKSKDDRNMWISCFRYVIASTVAV